jgi:hypothetical protein
MEITINELLSLCRIVRERLHELKDLRKQISTKDRFYGAVEKEVEPQYSVQFVDAKITKLQNFLFKADSKIKQSNAITKIEIDANADDLLAPLQ